MSQHTKYGYCRGAKRWVARDEMLSVNVKGYNDRNEEEKIQMRFSPDAYKQFMEVCRSYRWDNLLRTERELMSEGLLSAV